MLSYTHYLIRKVLSYATGAWSARPIRMNHGVTSDHKIETPDSCCVLQDDFVAITAFQTGVGCQVIP